MHDIDMTEVGEDFARCWEAASRHIGRKAESHPGREFTWLKSDLAPPFLEHLSFRVGNQIYFVRIEDQDRKMQVPGTPDGVRTIARGWAGHACLMPMRRSNDGWECAAPGWGLVDLDSQRPIHPDRLATDEAVEMTDWELHDFAVQVVRNFLAEQGREIMSSQGNPAVDPSLWFVGDDGPEWVVVRAVRDPARDARRPENWPEIAESCSRLSSIGHFASISVASSDERTNRTGRPNSLIRGRLLQVHFPGLDSEPALTADARPDDRSADPEDAIGQRLIDQLIMRMSIDEEWSLKSPNRLTWWSGHLAQHVWADPPIDDEGIDVHQIHIRTDLARGYSGTSQQLELLGRLSTLSTLSAVVRSRDEPERLQLACKLNLHAEVSNWLTDVASWAAVIQATEAYRIATLLSTDLGSSLQFTTAHSEHPRSGPRNVLDGILDAVEEVVIPKGEGPSAWIGDELETILGFLERPPCVLALGEETGLSAEFPFGRETSLLRIRTDQTNPVLGNGCLLTLEFPPSAMSGLDQDCWMQWNEAEDSSFIPLHLLGSWCIPDGRPTFVSFLPNAMHRRGALTNLVLPFVARARWATKELFDRDFDANFESALDNKMASLESRPSSKKPKRKWWKFGRE